MMSKARFGRKRKPGIIEISPPVGRPQLQLAEVWDHLDIIYILAVRDIKVRYKQSLAGVGWAVIQPLLTMIVFTAVFAGVVKVPTEGSPYPLFSLAALVPWAFFVHAITKGTSCVVANKNIATRVYFPRLVLPISAVVGGLVDFVVAFTLLMILLLVYGAGPTMGIFLLPVFLLFAMLSALSLSLWLSAINVQFRDVNNALPFFTQILMFISPVAYPSSVIPEKWQMVYALNPMATVIDGFRWALLEGQPAPGPYNLISVAIVFVSLLGGLYFFRWQEDRFADVV
jgi:lipopolysaccharide transport system permease protein